MKETIETFEIRFQYVDDRSGNLRLEWENTAVIMNVESDVDAMVDASIQKMLTQKSTNSWDYYFAAKYYFRNKRGKSEIISWMDKSIELDPVYWVIFEYAEMLIKMNKKREALEAAQKALEKAKDANDPRFAKNQIIPLIQLLETD